MDVFRVECEAKQAAADAKRAQHPLAGRYDELIAVASRYVPDGVTVEMCRHPSVIMPTFWLFRDGSQIAAVACEGAEWRASRMSRGMPYAQQRDHFARRRDPVRGGTMTRPKFYRLIDRLPVPCADVLEWGRWFETSNRRVAESHVGPLRVSTVFLGMDHNFGRDGDAVLFETMIFGADPESDSSESYCRRCSTWAQAERQHARAVAHAERVVADTGL